MYIYLFTRFARFHSRKEWVSMNGNEEGTYIHTYTCNANPKLDNETHVRTNNLNETTSLVPFFSPPLFLFALFSSQLLISSPVLPKLQSNDHPHLRVPVWGTLWITLIHLQSVGLFLSNSIPNIGCHYFWPGQKIALPHNTLTLFPHNPMSTPQPIRW